MTSDPASLPPVEVAPPGPGADFAGPHVASAAPDQRPCWRRKKKRPETRAARRERLVRAAGEAIALAAQTNGDPVALMAAATGTEAKYCDPVIRRHATFSALRARFLMPEERERLECETRMAAAVAAEPGPVIWVRRQFNNRRSRRAAYRLADVSRLHWSSHSGGKRRRVNRPYLHGYVWCDAMITGVVAHSCRHGPPPHHIKVCLTKIDNKGVWPELERAAPPRRDDARAAGRRPPRKPGKRKRAGKGSADGVAVRIR